MNITRTWFAECAYNLHHRFYFGTVTADSEEHARQNLLTKWGEISPHSPPDFLAVIPGQIIVVPLENRED